MIFTFEFYQRNINKYRRGACVNSRSWLAIISKSEGADMLRRKTGCFTMGFTDLASDTDLEAIKSGEIDKNNRPVILSTMIDVLV